MLKSLLLSPLNPLSVFQLNLLGVLDHFGGFWYFDRGQRLSIFFCFSLSLRILQDFLGDVDLHVQNRVIQYHVVCGVSLLNIVDELSKV